MIQYDIVGYAPRSPCDWYIQVGKGRATAEKAAKELLGQGWVYRGVRPAAKMVEAPGLVGISVCGPVIIVIWTGQPDTALRWSRLTHDPKCQRFHVGSYPASNGLEASWIDADGLTRRHLAITDATVTVDEGTAFLFDEKAETDPSIWVNFDSRLPKSAINGLLNAAGPSDVDTYDGRRYVRTDDQAIIDRARIVREDQHGRTWVAVDQSGKVNTLRDPISPPVTAEDLDALADQLVRTWFRLSLVEDRTLPPMHTFTWPSDPTYSPLAETMQRIYDDPAEFFGLLAAAREAEDIGDILSEHYGLSPTDVVTLLGLPLHTLLRPD